jgi:hypothetical protein
MVGGFLYGNANDSIKLVESQVKQECKNALLLHQLFNAGSTGGSVLCFSLSQIKNYATRKI